jgi:hypothetical protein
MKLPFVNLTALRPKATPILVACGVDVKRFWLLVDLFNQISERGEMMDQLGRNGVALKGAAIVYFVFSGLIAVLFALMPLPEMAYLGIFMALTAVLLVSVLISEAGNSLLNPLEAMVLAHQPIDGATYTAAKLSHLLSIVLYLVPGINAVPALAGLLLKDAPWYYPFLHLAAAFAVGLVSALFCCALFGWLLRFVPVKRLKAAGQLAGTIPLVVMMFGRGAGKLLRWFPPAALIPNGPALWWGLGITLGAAAIAAVVFGLRSLTADYLLRVASLSRGGAHAGSRTRKPKLGAIVRRFFGGQPALAGFSFVSRMMMRDWQFRRQMIPLLMVPVVSLGSAFSSGGPTDPLLRKFTPIHVMPHALGFLLLFVCALMRFGDDYKGVWVFVSIPSGALDGFARGVHALLWLDGILIPNLIALPVLAWRWGIGHAALFIAYSIAATSVYLALELRLIENVPFSKQMDTSIQSLTLPLLLGSAFFAGIAVAVQYFLIFRSPLIVAVSTVVLGIAAWFGTKASLGTFAVAMRYHLGLLSAETGTIYKEVPV